VFNGAAAETTLLCTAARRIGATARPATATAWAFALFSSPQISNRAAGNQAGIRGQKWT